MSREDRIDCAGGCGDLAAIHSEGGQLCIRCLGLYRSVHGWPASSQKSGYYGPLTLLDMKLRGDK